MFKLKDILKWSALSLALSFVIIFSARAQTSSSTGCSGTSCQTDAKTTCTSGGGKWCLASDQVSGWCSYSSSPCPANDAPSCTAQGGEWCTYSGSSGGYCNSVPGSCPINDQATCTSKNRKWCAGTSGGTGWCATTGSTCPANDAPSCTAQGGEWCTPSYGGTGWCNSMLGSCPVNDKATCETKGRSWCSDSSSTGGWCASTGGTCPGASGTTVNTTPVPTTPTYPTMSWPSTESDCTKYKGVWCKSTATYSSTYTMPGACYYAGQTCPVTPPAGKMSCWDGSFVDNYSSCPTTPSTKTDCTGKGYKWCDSTASTYSTTYTGWCMGSNSSCPTYPPAGKMSCPDGVTFATTLTDCPTAQTTVAQPTTKTCPDGKVVDASAACPVTFKTCPDGSKVETTVTCPVKTEDPATTCLSKGGKWCLDKAGGTGYCAAQGVCGLVVENTVEQKTIEQTLGLDQKQIKLVEAKKKEYLRSLDTLEKTIKRFDDQQSLAKIAALREKLSNLPADDNALDSLEAVKDDILALRDVKNDLIENQGDINLSERDRAMQAKALKQLKQGMVQFARQLDRIEAKANRLEKQGFTVPAALRELITQGRDFSSKIKDTKEFEVARDMGEALASLSEDLNLWMPRLEQLARVSQMAKIIQNEINKREAEYKRVQALVTRLKVDLEAYMGAIRTKLDAVKEVNSQLNTKEWGEEEPFDFVQESVIDKLADVDEALTNVRELASLKATVNKMKGQISRYDARIARLAKQKKDVAELSDLLAQLKDVYSQLNELAGAKLADLDLANVVEKLGAADNLMEQLDDLLKISAPSALEKALRGGLKVEKIETPTIERQVIRAYRVATFFRRAPQEMAEYFSSSVKEAVNRWRNRLAIDE